MAIPITLTVQQANGQVLLTWPAIADATGYVILKNGTITINAGTALSYLDTTVTVNTTYTYTVTPSGSTTYTSSAIMSVTPTESGFATLAQIRLQAQQRADMVNSNFVSTTEWNDYIRASYQELYDLVVDEYEDWILATPYTILTDGITNSYTLPDGTVNDSVTGLPAKPFYRLLGVDMGLANNDNAWVTMHKFDFIERNRYVYPNISASFAGVFNMRYRIMGNTLRLIPTPSAGQYIRLWYVPRLALPLQDTDVLDGINGWLEYVVVDAAIKAMQKEESDVTVLGLQKAALIKRIEESAANRDISEPDRISNSRRTGDGWGGYGGPGFDGSYGGF